VMKTLQIIRAVLLLLLGCSQVSAEDPRELVSALKQGVTSSYSVMSPLTTARKISILLI